MCSDESVVESKGKRPIMMLEARAEVLVSCCHFDAVERVYGRPTA